MREGLQSNRKGDDVHYVTSERIVSHKILNDATGELEAKDFMEMKQKKKLKGGFSMVYLDYDEAVESIIRSQLDFSLVVAIRKMFTYKRVEVVLSATDISQKFSVSKSKVDLLIKKMLTASLLKRVSRGTYRLNPYMYLPFRADGPELQAEWNKVTTS